MTLMDWILTGGLGATLLALAWIDFRTGYLPDILQIVAAALGVVALVLGSPIGVTLVPALFGAFGAAAVFYALRFIVSRLKQREAMGLGDVKLIAVAGLWLGWWEIPWVMLVGGVATLAGALIAAVVTGKDILKGEMPLGPGLAAGFFGVYLTRLITGPSPFVALY